MFFYAFYFLAATTSTVNGGFILNDEIIDVDLSHKKCFEVCLKKEKVTYISLTRAIWLKIMNLKKLEYSYLNFMKKYLVLKFFQNLSVDQQICSILLTLNFLNKGLCKTKQ